MLRVRELFLLDLPNLFNSALVAAAGELCGKPGAHDLGKVFRRRDPRAERKDIRVVVLAGQPRRFFIPGNGSANTRDLVGSDCHSRPRAADQQSLIDVSLRHLLADLARIVRIIDRFLRDRAQIFELNSELIEQTASDVPSPHNPRDRWRLLFSSCLTRV